MGRRDVFLCTATASFSYAAEKRLAPISSNLIALMVSRGRFFTTKRHEVGGMYCMQASLQFIDKI
jgi:hypothetical protein